MKNKGFNKQGLEKAGIAMRTTPNGAELALPPTAQMEAIRKQQAEQQARQELQSLINFRSTCAMNNLGCLLTATCFPNDRDELSTPEAIAKNEPNVALAVALAERLMVHLKMIPSTEFFRELEKSVEQPQQEPGIVTE